jgi:hypothetical protein
MRFNQLLSQSVLDLNKEGLFMNAACKRFAAYYFELCSRRARCELFVVFFFNVRVVAQ